MHVQDISHENYSEQRKHVEHTLQSLLVNSKNAHNVKLLENIVNVGNKSDLVADINQVISSDDRNDLKLISSTTLAGINDLEMEVERKILAVTNRAKITVKVPMGGEESLWLYKNAAVTESKADPKDSQNILLSVVISESKLQQFKHHFLKR